jgi:hypothetical protein
MMILNTYTTLFLFIAALTGLLAVPIWYLSLKTYLQTGKTITEEERDSLVDRSYLLFLIAAIILAVKLVDWPVFYVTLQSVIPHIHGAMCIFGVTQAQPVLSGIVQVLKPLIFFSIGGWLILRRLGQAHESSPLFRTQHLFLAAVSLLIFLDSSMDLLYFTSFDTGTDVACCTTVFDLAAGKRAALTTSLIGKGYDRALLPLYFFSNIMVIAFLAYSSVQMTRGRLPLAKTTVTGAIFAAINAAITIAALFEVISPRAMDLPYHHCIYCMWQYAPMSVMMTAFFVIGTFSPGWALVLAVAGKHDADGATLLAYQRKLDLIGIGGIGLSVCMAGWYVFLKSYK